MEKRGSISQVKRGWEATQKKYLSIA